MAKRDYYDVLGVAKNAAADEIKKAHRRLVRQYHPDANKGKPNTEDKFKEIQEAYDVLSDSDKRAKYDQFGHAGLGAGAPGADPYEAFRRAQGGRGGPGRSSWNAGPNVSVEDFDFGGMGGAGGAGGWNDIFEQVFNQGRPGGRGGRGRQRAEPPANVDVEHTVTITFEQAARGTTLPLQINRDGRIETIDVKVPAGVKDGSRIRLRGKGGYAGGQHGDLYITTKVEPHPWFRREELDLYLDLPVSFDEAMLGAKVEAPTLDGPVSLTIPPCTSSGAKLRIRGRGVERAGQRGDQFVVVRVMLPKDLDAEDKHMIEQIARKHPMNPRAELRW